MIAAHLAVKENLLYVDAVNRLVLGKAAGVPMQLLVDNSAVVRNARRGVSAQLSWLHLAVRLRIGMLRDLAELGLVDCHYVASAYNRADGFSKALARLKLEEHREFMGVF